MAASMPISPPPMMTSFSTRNRKQTKEVPTTKKVVNQNKKKVSVLKDAIGADQFSLTKEDNIIKLTFKPQESVTFLSDNHSGGSDYIFLNVNTEPAYNDIIKNATGSETVKIYLEKLTLKQTDTTVDCNFLPFQTGTEGDRVTKISFTYNPQEGSTTGKKLNIDEGSPIVTTLQVVNMDPSDTYITPVESAKAQFESADLNTAIPKVEITGSYQEAYLTNFRIEGVKDQDKHYTQLVVKGDTKYWMGLPKRSHPSTSTETNDYWTVYSVNEIVDTGIQVSENSEETKKIGIDNALATGAATNENDSSIDLTTVTLTEDQLKQSYWNNFYVNQVTMWQSQKDILDGISPSTDQWTMTGYRVTTPKNANVTDGSLIIKNDTLVKSIKEVESNLVVTFSKQEEFGFCGKLDTRSFTGSDGDKRVLDIYSTVTGDYSEGHGTYDSYHFVLPSMRKIITGTDNTIDDCFYIKDANTEDPTKPYGFDYICLHIKDESSTWFNPLYIKKDKVKQIITEMNVIHGTVGNGLYVPLPISNVYSDNKMTLPTVTFSDADVELTTLKTTNCLAINAKLNLVVQGEMPFEWYDKWLPLENVYVSPEDKTVVVDPTSTTGLTRLYSINDLPDATEDDEIGISIAQPNGDFDPGNDQGIYSWMDMTRLADFTSVDNKINNSDDKKIFFVNMIKLRDELKDAEIPFSQWNGTTKEESWVVPIEMEYTELITDFAVETGTSTKSLVITFEDQITNEFLEPKTEGETSKVLDISNNEDLSKTLSEKLKDLETGSVGPEILCLNKLRLINSTDNIFFTNFYTTALQSIEIKYLKYVDGTTQGIIDSHVINTADSTKKIINRVNNLLVIKGSLNNDNLLEPINALQTGSGDSLVTGVFEKETKSVHLDTARINDKSMGNSNIYNDNVVPEVSTVKAVNVLVPKITNNSGIPYYPDSTTNIVVKGEIPSWIYNCLDTTNGAGQLNINSGNQDHHQRNQQRRVHGEIHSIHLQLSTLKWKRHRSKRDRSFEGRSCSCSTCMEWNDLHF